jgi:hypothetical protein
MSVAIIIAVCVSFFLIVCILACVASHKEKKRVKRVEAAARELERHNPEPPPGPQIPPTAHISPRGKVAPFDQLCSREQIRTDAYWE